MNVDIYFRISFRESSQHCAVTKQDLCDLEQRIMTTLEEVLAKVEANTTVLGSLNALLDGLRTEVQEVLSGARIPPAVQAKVDAIFTAAQAQGVQLDEVLLENTPAATTPPTP